VAELTRTERTTDAVRITRGAYLSRALPFTPPHVVRSALEVLPLSAVASHGTAAVLLGAPIDFDPPMEFAVPPGVYRRRGIRIHVRDLTAADRTILAGLPLTAGAQTWLDLAAVLPADELVAVGDALYRRKHLDAGSFTARLDRADGVRGVVPCSGSGALAHASGCLASGEPGSVLAHRWWPAGAPAPGARARPAGT